MTKYRTIPKLTEQQFSNFQKNINKTDSCWLWTASTMKGYGQIGFYKKNYLAHRVSYVLSKGVIPDGLQLDHLCRVRSCVNPDHLEPVTNQVNASRGLCGVKTGAMQLAKTHCKKGHAYDSTNTYITPRGSRHCKECSRDSVRKSRIKKLISKGDSQWAHKTVW